MNLHIYNPEIRAKAISNQESAAKAMSLNGHLSTPQFELELEAALVKANPPPKHHTSEITGKLTKIHTYQLQNDTFQAVMPWQNLIEHREYFRKNIHSTN